MGKPKIYIKKLGRYRINGHQVIGMADTDTNEIWLDPRQTDCEFRETALHERFHISFPDWSEFKIQKIAKAFNNYLIEVENIKTKLK